MSQWSAASLWSLQTDRARAGAVDVSATRGDHFRRPGIRFHRVLTLQPDEVTELDGIPITTVCRTVADLAGVAERRELQRLYEDALSRSLLTRDELRPFLARRVCRAGRSRLRALLDNDVEPAWTRSAAERRFLELVRKAQLPVPARNATVNGHRVDFFWRAEQFVVDVDGYAFHSSAEKFESDRRRDAELAAAGVRVIRVTWRQLMHEREAVLVRLVRALPQR